MMPVKMVQTLLFSCQPGQNLWPFDRPGASDGNGLRGHKLENEVEAIPGMVVYRTPGERTS